MDITYHEKLYRSSEAMSQLKGRLVTVCGAGALGANLVESLARSGVDTLKVVDMDRVEEHNLSTQPYALDDVGGRKAEVLSHNLYRAVGVDVAFIAKRLDHSNIKKLLKDSTLVVDCFDNSPSRGLVTEHCSGHGIVCLHSGMADGFAEVIWNEHYRVPSESQDDICDYPLARNLVTLAVGITCETILRYLIDGVQENWSLTLKDLSVRKLELE